MAVLLTWNMCHDIYYRDSPSAIMHSTFYLTLFSANSISAASASHCASAASINPFVFLAHKLLFVSHTQGTISIRKLLMDLAQKYTVQPYLLQIWHISLTLRYCHSFWSGYQKQLHHAYARRLQQSLRQQESRSSSRDEKFPRARLPSFASNGCCFWKRLARQWVSGTRQTQERCNASHLFKQPHSSFLHVARDAAKWLHGARCLGFWQTTGTSCWVFVDCAILQHLSRISDPNQIEWNENDAVCHKTITCQLEITVVYLAWWTAAFTTPYSAHPLHFTSFIYNTPSSVNEFSMFPIWREGWTDGRICTSEWHINFPFLKGSSMETTFVTKHTIKISRKSAKLLKASRLYLVKCNDFNSNNNNERAHEIILNTPNKTSVTTFIHTSNPPQKNVGVLECPPHFLYFKLGNGAERAKTIPDHMRGFFEQMGATSCSRLHFAIFCRSHKGEYLLEEDCLTNRVSAMMSVDLGFEKKPTSRSLTGWFFKNSLPIARSRWKKIGRIVATCRMTRLGIH